jgi:hypothetical protein
VDVISIGTFCGVFISPLTKPALANTAASNKTRVRMAHAERTGAEASCKAKTAYGETKYAGRAISTSLQAESRPRYALINPPINGFLHPG